MTRVALSVGNFDGVHLGHAALIERARGAVGPDGRVIVLTFEPHPMRVLRPERAPERLSTFEQRRAALLELGADEVERLTPTQELLGRSASAFVEGCVRRFEVDVFVEGADFCFGKGREGDIAMLRRLGEEHGYRVEVVDEVEATLSNAHVVRCSSTLARWLLGQGRVEDASLVLGRPYAIEGEVVRGDRRGRAIGFPTANVSVAQEAPKDGVYAGLARAGGAAGSLPAAVHVGPRATFDAHERTIEVHLIGWTPADGRELYGERLSVTLERWVRGNVRFESVGHLVEQLGRDVARVKALLERDRAGGVL